MLPRINRAQSRVLANLLDDRRMVRLIEQEALRPGSAYTLTHMLDDVRRGLFSELAATSVSIDPYRRGLQMQFLSLADAKLNPPPASPNTPAFLRREPLSDVAAAQLRGELTTLRADVERAMSRAADRSVRYHLIGLQNRIDHVLDPRG